MHPEKVAVPLLVLHPPQGGSNNGCGALFSTLRERDGALFLLPAGAGALPARVRVKKIQTASASAASRFLAQAAQAYQSLGARISYAHVYIFF